MPRILNTPVVPFYYRAQIITADDELVFDERSLANAGSGGVFFRYATHIRTLAVPIPAQSASLCP
jgi:hypothetical protein